MDNYQEILERLARIETKLEKMNILDGHEKRLRFLERYAYLLIGVFSLIMLIVNKFIK